MVRDLPCASNTPTLLNDNKVAAVILSDQINGSTHPRDTSSDDKNGGVGMIRIAYLDLRPRLVADFVWHRHVYSDA